VFEILLSVVERDLMWFDSLILGSVIHRETSNCLLWLEIAWRNYSTKEKGIESLGRTTNSLVEKFSLSSGHISWVRGRFCDFTFIP
jgi:hypothetical protein